MCIASIKAFKLIANIGSSLVRITTIMFLKNNNTYNAKLIIIAFFVTNLYSFNRN